MFPRRSLSLPITLGVVMIVLLVVLTVGWILLSVSGWEMSTSMLVTVLSLGTTFLVLCLVGVVFYLTLSIKAINLNRRQSNFIDAVTHELKSPIASLKLYLQTLDRRHVSDEQRQGFYGYMLEDLERLDHLINQVLSAGRLEKPAVSEDWEDIDLASVIRDCAQAVCLRYRIPVDTIRLDLQAGIVRGIRVELEMIFRNLLDNAIKYAGSEPVIKVTLAPASKDRLIARISDNGRGIPPGLRRKIFGRFERLGLELQRERPGTGLGLYIVRTLVRRLKGRVRVCDNDDGSAGTVFEVVLPAVSQQASRNNTPHEQGSATATASETPTV